MVKVNLIKTERLPPRTTTAVTVEIDGADCKGPMVVELNTEMEESGFSVDSVLWPEEKEMIHESPYL